MYQAYREKMEESIDNSVDVKNRFPVFTQDVEANVSFQINIGMINLHKKKQRKQAIRKQRWSYKESKYINK